MSHQDHRSLRRKALNFFSYWSRADKVQTTKGREVQNLAEHYQGMGPDQKAKLLQECFCGKHNEDAADYLEQKMQTIAASVSSDEEQWLTLSQIGDKTGIDKDSFESLDQYFAEVKKEVADNHRSMGLRRVLVLRRREAIGGTDTSTRAQVPRSRQRQTTASVRWTRLLSHKHLHQPLSGQMRLDKMQEMKQERPGRGQRRLQRRWKAWWDSCKQQGGSYCRWGENLDKSPDPFILRLEAAENFWIDFSNKELTSDDFECLCEMCEMHESDLFTDFPTLCPSPARQPQLKNIEQPQLKNIELEDKKDEEEE